MQTWKTLSKQTLLNHSKYLRVENHTIELPDGCILENWPWLIMPEFVNVAAFTLDDRVLCFRQTKYSLQGTSLAPVGGYLEPGEEPLEAAKRELREETGYEALEWSFLGDFIVDANRGAGKGYFFLAQKARLAGKISSDDLEEQELLMLSREEVRKALLSNAVKIMPWAMALSLALLQVPAD
jgi:ADP-ribose pyrophosphatase